jgi:hypothetical protein
MQPMYYIGLDVHKRTISYCVKDGSGAIHAEGTLPATRLDLDRWMKTLHQPWTAAMEATVFTGWIGITSTLMLTSSGRRWRRSNHHERGNHYRFQTDVSCCERVW